MDLTTLTRLKLLMEIDATDSRFNSALSQLISEVSAGAERLMERHAKTEAREEQYDLSPGQDAVLLRGYGDPNSAITEVKNSATRNFAGVSAIDSDLYYFSQSSGVLTFDTGLTTGAGVLQVSYSGGLGADASEAIANFPDIAQAVEMQVAHLWQRRGELGLQTVSFQGGSVSGGKEHGHWLELTREILRRHRRRRIGV